MFNKIKSHLKSIIKNDGRNYLIDSNNLKIRIVYLNEIDDTLTEFINNAFDLLRQDHEIIDKGLFNQSNISNLSGADLIIFVGCVSNLSPIINSFLKKTKQATALISTNYKSENISNTKAFDVLFFRNYDYLIKNLSQQIRLHGIALDRDKLLFFDPYYFYSQLRTGIQLLKKNQTKASNRIISKPNLKVGFNTFHNGNFNVRGDIHAVLGSFCSLGKNISLYTVNHDIRFPTTQGYLYREYFKQQHPGALEKNYSRYRSKGPIVIKNDVWIGDDVKIMSGVTIGNGACIGAGAIVTKNVEDYEIVAGTPAHHISYRYSETIVKELLEQQWWSWSNKKIENNHLFFSTDLTTVEGINHLIK